MEGGARVVRGKLAHLHIFSIWYKLYVRHYIEQKAKSMKNCLDMLEKYLLKIWGFLRALCSTLCKNWALFLLAIYAVASLLYQASAPWRERTLGTGRADYQVASVQDPSEEYRLAIHYPTTIPLEVAGERGRPLVAWLWGSPLTATTTTTATWRLIITATNETRPNAPTNIIFTNKDGLEIASALDLQPRASEPEAPRSILYISRLADGRGTSYAQLSFQLWRDDAGFTLTPTPNVPVTVELESRSAAFWRKLLDLILNTPALTWVSVVTIGVNFWVRQREKKVAEAKELQNKIQALKDMPIQQAWQTYWNLYRAKEHKQELQKAWREIETLHPLESSEMIRRWLIDRIPQCGVSLEECEALWRDITHAQSSLKSEEVETLREFFFAQDTSETDLKENFLKIALRSFRILGVNSRDEVIKRLDRAANEAALEIIKDEYYRKGGLAGRMLLRAWGQQNSDLGKKFTKWLGSDPVPESSESIKEKGTCALWHTTSFQLSPAHLALLKKVGFPHPAAWFTPFGPEKAEDDPRLCNLDNSAKKDNKDESRAENETPWALFYDKMPWYTEITAELHSLFYAPPGCGRTAVIWNARHTHRTTRYKPALSLYFLLRPPFEPAHLLKLVADALGRALCCALVEDAYWLMAADREIQADIGRFLLWWAGDIVTLLQRLREGGLPITTDLIRNTNDESDSFYDALLLTDIFSNYTSMNTMSWDFLTAATRASRVAMGNVYPSTEDGWNYPVYLWMDCNFPKLIASREIPRLWDNEFLRRMGNLKIFTRYEFSDLGQIRMEWDDHYLYKMLKHRLERVRADLFLDQEKLGDDSYKSLQEFRRELLDKAHSPQEVIRRGNRLFEQLGDPLMGEK